MPDPVVPGTAHFSIAEFTHSDLAVRLGINNILPAELVSEAFKTLMLLEAIRTKLSTLLGRA